MSSDQKIPSMHCPRNEPSGCLINMNCFMLSHLILFTYIEGETVYIQESKQDHGCYHLKCIQVVQCLSLGHRKHRVIRLCWLGLFYHLD